MTAALIFLVLVAGAVLAVALTSSADDTAWSGGSPATGVASPRLVHDELRHRAA